MIGIRNLKEIPKSCSKCLLAKETFAGMTCYDFQDVEQYVIDETKPDWCDLVEIKEDADGHVK